MLNQEKSNSVSQAYLQSIVITEFTIISIFDDTTYKFSDNYKGSYINGL